MKFYITRASALCSDTEPPCQEAKLVGPKVRKGTDGTLYVSDSNIWTIEIESLDQLLAFVNKYDAIVVDSPDKDSNIQGQFAIPSITIYDYYLS